MKIKRLILAGLTALTLGITGCNQQTKTCENNTEAIEYATQTGFSAEESKIFQPLGNKCTLTSEDKEFIRLMHDIKEKGETTKNDLEKIVERFGKTDETGEQYTISKPEINAIKYAYYDVYPEFKSIDNTIKFQEWMIKGFLPLDIGAKLQGINNENMGSLSFPIVTNIDYTGDGKLDNFMSIPGVLTADSDKIKDVLGGGKTGCGDAVEILREGYDYMIKVNHDVFFVNTTFTNLELVHLVEEKFSSGEWRFPSETYSLFFIPEYRDSSLYPEDFMIILAHTYLYKDSSNKNKPPELGYILKGTKIDETGKIIPPEERQTIKLIYNSDSGIIDEDYNYLTTSSENTIEENKDFFTKGEGIAFKTYYYKGIYDPRNPLGIFPTTKAKITEITATKYIVDFSRSVSAPEIQGNPNDEFVCKVIYDKN